MLLRAVHLFLTTTSTIHHPRLLRVEQIHRLRIIKCIETQAQHALFFLKLLRTSYDKHTIGSCREKLRGGGDKPPPPRKNPALVRKPPTACRPLASFARPLSSNAKPPPAPPNNSIIATATTARCVRSASQVKLFSKPTHPRSRQLASSCSCDSVGRDPVVALNARAQDQR